MADGGGSLLQRALQQVGASQRLLFLGSVVPVSGGESQGLDGSKLSDGAISMGKSDLDERDERLRLRVVVLLKIGCGGLDLFRVG